jgi:homoserine kinase
MIRVRIPATVANLGPGFDCMGLALDLWNSLDLYIGGNEISLESHGEGASALPRDESNLIAQTLIAEFQKLTGARPGGFRIISHNQIPVASGLGSSSTATLAGVIFAHAWHRHLQNQDPCDLNLDEILARAVEIEGHGDNVAPALLGGLVIVVPDETGVLSQRIPYVPIKAVVCVPEFDYLTTDARKALPDSYSKSDAIYNIGRAVLVAEALRAGDDDQLARCMNDRIHQRFRLPAIPGAPQALDSAKENGAVAVCLSGAGPGVIAFSRDHFDRIGRGMKDAFATAGLNSRYWILDPTSEGTHFSRLPV